MQRIELPPQPRTKLVLWSFLFLLGLAGVALLQNVLRYGQYEGYNIWRSLGYLAFSVFGLLPLLPGALWAYRRGLGKASPWGVLLAVVFMGTAAAYLLSALGLFAMGYFDAPVSVKYLRQYVSRELSFHVLTLVGLWAYVRLSEGAPTTLAKTISATRGRKEIIVRADQVRWIEADDHYLRIHMDEAPLLKRATLEYMTQELQPEFVRIHRKYLVNRGAIVGKEKQQKEEYVVLVSGERLKVGRSYRPVEF